MQMNYMPWVVAALFLVTASWWFMSGGQSVSSFKNYPPRNETIVAFGDSLVQGVGATEGNDLFSQVSKLTGKRIINKGVSGDTTRDGLARINEVLDLNPGVVVVLLGGNDYLRQIPKEETFKNLRTIIAQIQGSGAVVIIAGVRGGLLSDYFQAEYKKLVREYHAGYVSNVLKGIIGHERYMADPIHPNDVGYARIAERIAPLIIELYK